MSFKVYHTYVRSMTQIPAIFFTVALLVQHFYKNLFAWNIEQIRDIFFR